MPTKAREILENKNGEIRLMSSGVTIKVTPFPSGMWSKINARCQRDFPDPPIPKKTINVLGGTEEVDDLENSSYKEAKQVTDNKRNNFLGESVLDICVEVDMDQWESKIKRIEQRTEPYPEDPDDRRVRFLSEYAIRSAGDWQFVFASALEQTQVTDQEVSERINNFQRKVARSTDNGVEAPGVDEVKRVDV